MWFISGFQWVRGSMPLFPSDVTTHSHWAPVSGCIDEHPLVWLQKNPNVMQLMWWTKVQPEDRPEEDRPEEGVRSVLSFQCTCKGKGFFSDELSGGESYCPCATGERLKKAEAIHGNGSKT